MPFYEYKAKFKDKSCKYCKKSFEISQSIKSEPLPCCPKCGNEIEKLVSLPAGHVIKGRQINTYNDVLKAKYWRDKNGIRHRVTPADGHSKSSTVDKQTASPELIAARKKVDAEKDKIRRRNSNG